MAIKSGMPLLSPTNHLRSSAFCVKRKNDQIDYDLIRIRDIAGTVYPIVFFYRGPLYISFRNLSNLFFPAVLESESSFYREINAISTLKKNIPDVLRLPITGGRKKRLQKYSSTRLHDDLLRNNR